MAFELQGALQMLVVQAVSLQAVGATGDLHRLVRDDALGVQEGMQKLTAKLDACGATGHALAGDARIAECRSLVSRSALLGAGVSLLPVPGLDVAADAALLAQLIHRINLRLWESVCGDNGEAP